MTSRFVILPRNLQKYFLIFVVITISSCAKQSTEPPKDTPEPVYTEFVLTDEWSGPYVKQDTIDINAGHSPENFVKAAYWQVYGTEPSSQVVSNWANKLTSFEYVRRIDVVRTFCQDAGRTNYALKYSDPWKGQVELTLEDGAQKITNRDVGAVFMYFFNTPGGVNGTMDWANTHFPGMDVPSPILGFDANKSGYYDPKSNPGFWYRELQDAKYAGLDFLLLNTYGPDLDEGAIETLNQALLQLDDPIKLAFFDDTWAWSQPYFGEFWEEAPDLADTEAAAQKIYTAKWKKFFTKIPQKHWYLVEDKPFIYFYNAGTLKPAHHAAPVIQRMKELFEQDFGVEPFVAVDRAFFIDNRMPDVADGRFTWFTHNIAEHKSRETMNGITLDHAMVKWDEMGRSKPDEIATSSDRIIKGADILEEILTSSADADILVIATWNDLGEGTGINRNYDYFINGEWKKPTYFMDFIRAAQLGL